MRSREVLAYGLAGAAVTATAALGGKAVDTGSTWYRLLRKPSWQPPGWAFGAVWTPLYATIGWSAGHALLRTSGRTQKELIAAYAVNLSTNAAWNWLFFARRNPLAGLAATIALDISNADLIRRTRRADRTAAGTLVPYAVWCLFATALNAAIVRRNR